MLDIINEHKNTLLHISNQLIKSNDIWIDFDKYINSKYKQLKQDPCHSVDTIYYNKDSSIDLIEFKGGSLINELTEIKKGGEPFNNYLSGLGDQDKFHPIEAIKHIKENHLYLKFKESTKDLNNSQVTLKLVVLSKDVEENKNKENIPPFKSQTVINTIKRAMKDILDIHTSYEEEFIEDYKITIKK